jgi:hypothetical protein
MQQGIIRITAQNAYGSPIEPECVLSKWRNDRGVVAREKCKIVCSWDDVTKEMQETLWGFIKEHYIFPSEQEKIGKNDMMKTISNAFQRFKHALKKYCADGPVTAELVWVYHTKRMGHIRTTIYHSTSRSPQ